MTRHGAGVQSRRAALGVPLLLGLLLPVLVAAAAGLVAACGGGTDKFVGSWAVDNPMPQTKRLAMTITKDGDTYSIDPTEGISNARTVTAKVESSELVGTVDISGGSLELRFKPGSDADKLDITMTLTPSSGAKASFSFTLQRVK
jgi:hypothetical protein